MRKSGEGLLCIATPGRKLLGVVVFLRRQEGCEGAAMDAAELKLIAERQLGEVLKEQEKQHGARGIGKKVELHDETPLLADQGITKIESHRWQKVATHQSPTPCGVRLLFKF